MIKYVYILIVVSVCIASTGCSKEAPAPAVEQAKDPMQAPPETMPPEKP